MSSEKRLVVFFILAVLSVQVLQYGLQWSGLVPPPPPPAKKAQAPVAAKGEPAKAADAPAADAPKAADAPEAADAPKAADAAKTGDGRGGPAPAAVKGGARVALAGPEELTLGSRVNRGPSGYRMELRLDQKGAGVAALTSAIYEAEFVEGKPKHRPLELLKPDPKAPPSLSMTLVVPRDPSVDDDAAAAAGVAVPGGGEAPLDALVWEVVRDPQGKAVRPVSRPARPSPVAAPRGPKPPAEVEGQEVVFRTRDEATGVVVTRRYRLFQGEDGFETDLTLESPDKAQSVTYKLLGPHGIPIEGEWYTGTFREAVFGKIKGSGTEVATLSAYDVAKRKDNPERFSELPLRYAGIENQYFAALLEPQQGPGGAADRWVAEAAPTVLHEDPENRQKADIGVTLTSKAVAVGPNVSATHAYRVFAGPKTVDALAAYGAEDLATYRKSNWIPFASFFARVIITPMLAFTYDVTRVVGGFFGRKTGNYGVAIILLTMLVRLMMFPLGRKQAIAAKKMQDLQPLLKQMQEKYKDDKEAQTKETWALYKRHGVNPVGGCLPALIQLPIFVGLWQALNNSVYLRHASFLWIDNLAAPDMLFRFPASLPLVSTYLGDYFNVLPFVVVALMLVQTKLFSPPATTPEAESQQKIMKYMMIFMAFMFYKVPSGLGLYFITSSLWQINERLLLPRVTPTPVAPAGGSDDTGGGGGRGGSGGGGDPPKPPGRFSKFMEKVLEEAGKNPTYRKLTDEKGQDRDRDRGNNGNNGRDKGKPRARPGKRR